MKSLRSLVITTSTSKSGDTENKTGVWMEDLAAPYFVLKDGGEFITIASPLGGQLPLDPKSLSPAAVTENTKRFMSDARAMYHLSHALPLNEASADSFDLVFLVGGYGAMWDFPDNTRIKEILESFNRQHKPMGFTGHAAAALVALTTADDTALVKGRRLTAFSNSEEAAAGLYEALPFSLESRLTALGALFSRGADFRSYTVTDDNLITGQNPASAVTAALQLLQLAQTCKEKAALSDSNKFY